MTSPSTPRTPRTSRTSSTSRASSATKESQPYKKSCIFRGKKTSLGDLLYLVDYYNYKVHKVYVQEFKKIDNTLCIVVRHMVKKQDMLVPVDSINMVYHKAEEADYTAYECKLNAYYVSTRCLELYISPHITPIHLPEPSQVLESSSAPHHSSTTPKDSQNRSSASAAHISSDIETRTASSSEPRKESPCLTTAAPVAPAPIIITPRLTGRNKLWTIRYNTKTRVIKCQVIHSVAALKILSLY